MKVPIKLTQRAWGVQPGKHILKTEGFDVGLNCLFQICDSLFFCFPFTIGRNIRNTGSEAAFFGVWDNFYGEVLRRGKPIPQRADKA